MKPEQVGAAMLGDGAAKTFILAGRAKVTLVSVKTGVRFTYKVTQHEHDPKVWFVSALTGPDNTCDFRFVGTIFAQAWGHPERFVRGVKSTVSANAPCVVAFAWAWVRFARGKTPTTCEVWHEGKCGKCGRSLTVPSSIATGLGPHCAARKASGSVALAA